MQFFRIEPPRQTRNPPLGFEKLFQDYSSIACHGRSEFNKNCKKGRHETEFYARQLTGSGRYAPGRSLRRRVPLRWAPKVDLIAKCKFWRVFDRPARLHAHLPWLKLTSLMMPIEARTIATETDRLARIADHGNGSANSQVFLIDNRLSTHKPLHIEALEPVHVLGASLSCGNGDPAPRASSMASSLGRHDETKVLVLFQPLGRTIERNRHSRDLHIVERREIRQVGLHAKLSSTSFSLSMLR